MLDCNLASLCDHIQFEGFNNGIFSDIVVHAMGSTYHLHRLILSRSSYFRNMLHGPWKEASAPVVALQIDDKNVNAGAIAIALAFLYGHHPKLNDDNAFRVLAAASFLDLQDLCAICTDFIIAELWTSNFLAYQVFAENQDYGIYGERVRSACWGYLCQSGYMELKEVLPRLSSQTLHALLTSNELWVPSEEKRFELALHTMLKKSALGKAKVDEKQSAGLEMGGISHHNSSELKVQNVSDACCSRDLETELKHVHQVACSAPSVGTGYPSNMEQPAQLTDSYSESDRSRSSSYKEVEVEARYQQKQSTMAAVQYERRQESHVEFSYEQHTSLSECFKEAENHYSEQSVKQCHSICSQNEPQHHFHQQALSIVAGAMKNRTGGALSLMHEHRWAGHFVKKYPHCINRHRHGSFLESSIAHKGCKAAVVYAGTKCDGTEYAFLLAWANTSHGQKVYVECGPKQKFDCINWEDIKCKLEGSCSKAKSTDCCTGTTAVAEIKGSCGQAKLAATFCT